MEGPEYVNGVSLTAGAVGLLLTFQAELERVAAAGDPGLVHIIAEDDARFVDGFGAKFSETLDALDALDPRWDFLQIGFFGAWLPPTRVEYCP